MSTTYTEPDLFDTLAAVHSDWRPSRVAARRVIRNAIHECARRHDGEVHIAWFRHLLPEWVAPNQIGAALMAWSKTGHLVSTGRYLPNGGPSGNAMKPALVRRLVAEIPPIKD